MPRRLSLKPLVTLVSVAAFALSQTACGSGSGSGTGDAPSIHSATGPWDPQRISGDASSTRATSDSATTSPETGETYGSTGIEAATENWSISLGITDGTLPPKPLPLKEGLLIGFAIQLDPASVSANTIYLEDDKQNKISASLTTSASKSGVTLFPDKALPALATLHLKLEPGLKSASGTTLDKEISILIPTADHAWDAAYGTPDLDTAGISSAPVFGLDSLGNAVAVWVHDKTVKASTMKADTGAWTAPITLYSGEDRNDAPTLPAIAVMPSGRAQAVWTANTGAGNEPHLFGASFRDGEWSMIGRIDKDIDYVMNVAEKSLVLNPSGDGAVVFNGMDSRTGAYGVFALNLAAGTWSAAQRLDTGDGQYPGNGASTTPKVVIDESGRLCATWLQMISGQRDIGTARRIPHAGAWYPNAKIPGTRNQAQHLSLSVSPLGKVALAYEDVDASGQHHVFATRAADMSQWTDPIQFSSAFDALEPNIAVDPSTEDEFVTFASHRQRWFGNLRTGGQIPARVILGRRYLAQLNAWEDERPVGDSCWQCANASPIYDFAGRALITQVDGNSSMSAARFVTTPYWARTSTNAGDLFVLSSVSKIPGSFSEVLESPIIRGPEPNPPAPVFDTQGRALQLWAFRLSEAHVVVRSARFR